jgi:periplasmic divalent cation tolerance protein
VPWYRTGEGSRFDLLFRDDLHRLVGRVRQASWTRPAFLSSMGGSQLKTNMIYVTAPNRDAALSLARALVGERLVACANVLDGATSVYWWEGKVCEEAEAVLVCKTRAELVDTVITRVRELHSYSCPCVVALSIEAGNPAYLDWIRTETGGLSSA